MVMSLLTDNKIKVKRVDIPLFLCYNKYGEKYEFKIYLW